MSIEEKAKAYDEALKYARIYYTDGDEDMKMMMKTCFPVLVEESEDEKIRKWCISHFKECINVIKDNDEYKEYLSNKVIAWLEKQGEQNPAWSEEDETTINNLVWAISNDCIRPQDREDYCDWLKSLKDRVQPKQEWSKEDDFMATAVENSFYLHCGQMTDRLSEQFKKFFEKVKSLKPQNTWKPSDEQLEAVDVASRNIDIYDYKEALESLYNNLKAL